MLNMHSSYARHPIVRGRRGGLFTRDGNGGHFALSSHPRGSMEQVTQATVRPQTLIAVRDVKASSAWYQTLLGVRSGCIPDHPHRLVYDRLMSGDTLILQLHSWD